MSSSNLQGRRTDQKTSSPPHCSAHDVELVFSFLYLLPTQSSSRQPGVRRPLVVCEV